MSEIKSSPYARKIAKQYHIDLQAVRPSGLHGEIQSADVERAHEGRERTREVPVTPLAMRIADSLSIDLSKIHGTGPGGKISKADVLSATGSIEPELMPGELRETLTGMRKVISERMTEAAKVPTCTVTTKVDMTALLSAREKYNKSHDPHCSINDLILFAVSHALTEHKRFLCSFDRNSVIYKNEINLGIAVAVEDGLIVPVLKNADLLTLSELASSAHELVRRARNRTLQTEECRGNTFTVTNLGMFGVEAFTPLINLPDAAILGVCAVSDGCLIMNDKPVVRKVMRICLTFDHRMLDGSEAAKFNLDVRKYLENPDLWLSGGSG